MPGLRCTVSSCKNSWEKGQKDGKKVKFFCFPKVPNLRGEWVEFCQRGGNWNPDFGRICEDHFKETDFERDLANELLGLPTRKLLKKDAVPSLFGPPCREANGTGNERRDSFSENSLNMPGMRCAVGVCNNSREKALKHGRDLKFFVFPKDPLLKNEWAACCRRDGHWNPSSSRICGDHFTEDDFERDLANELLGLPIRKFLKKDAVPSVLLTPEEVEKSSSEQNVKQQKRGQKKYSEKIPRQHSAGALDVAVTNADNEATALQETSQLEVPIKQEFDEEAWERGQEASCSSDNLDETLARGTIQPEMLVEVKMEEPDSAFDHHLTTEQWEDGEESVLSVADSQPDSADDSAVVSSKRKCLTLDDKVEIIRAIENGEKKSDVGRTYGLASSSINTIWRNKVKIMDVRKKGGKKRIRLPKDQEVEQLVLKWYLEQQLENATPPTGPMIKVQAEAIAERLGITRYKASEGWLYRFRQRNDLVGLKANEEEVSVDKNVNEDWLGDAWPKMNEKYSPEDVFHADETGLLYRLTPGRIQEFQDQKCTGGELADDRLTLWLAANMSGSEKRLLVVGKEKNPHSFKNVKALPVTYKASKNAWLTGELFEEELRKWDAELRYRKILLLVLNGPAHPPVKYLRNIKLVFLLANVKPMASIITNLKGFYRKRLLMRITDDSEGVTTSITLLDAVVMLYKAWTEVSLSAIHHSFAIAGLCCYRAAKQPTDDPDINLSLVDWLKIHGVPTSYSSEQLANFVSVDDALATTGAVADVNSDIQDKGTLNNDGQEDEEPPTVSNEEALKAARLLSRWFLTHENDVKMLQSVFGIENKVEGRYWADRRKENPCENSNGDQERC